MTIKLIFVNAVMLILTSQQLPQKTFIWGTRALEWTDYKGKPNSASAAMTMSVIHIGLEYTNAKTAKVMIEAVFDPMKSWVRNPTHLLLLHERGHFDIAELYARKLRKALIEKPLSEDEIFNLHRHYCQEMDKCQDRYDLETDFSRNVAKQKEWLISLENQLEGMKENRSGVEVRME